MLSDRSENSLSSTAVTIRNRESHRFLHNPCWQACCNRRLVAGSIGSFRDLEVWRLGLDLVDLVVEATSRLPASEIDLRRQMRRASMSIPTNIAEGYRRKQRRAAYQNHVSIAMGSLGELQTQLEIAFRNRFLDPEPTRELVAVCDRVGAMLCRLHDALD